MMEKIEANAKKKISDAVLRTLAFFDLFDYPLSSLEIWQGLECECDLEELEEILSLDVRSVEKEKGLYFLHGRKVLVKKRIQNYNLYNQKVAIAIRATKFLRFVNGVKMVAVCNNFSYSPDSDIDIFVIVQKNRMWLSRFFVTAMMHGLKMRRHGKLVRNRICLSFYVSETEMNLEKLMLEEKGGINNLNREQKETEKDIYFIHWLNDLLPLYGEKIFCDFIQANLWLKNFLPNFTASLVTPRFCVMDFWLSELIKGFNGFWFNSILGDWLDKLLKDMQLKMMKKNTASVASSNDTRVVISDMVLKFHENDRREEYRKRWTDSAKRFE